MIHQNQKYFYYVVIHYLFHFVSSKIENDSEIRKFLCKFQFYISCKLFAIKLGRTCTCTGYLVVSVFSFMPTIIHLIIFMQNCGYNYYGHFNEFSSIVFKVSLMALLNVRIHKTFLEAELQFSKSGCIRKYFLEFPFLMGFGIIGGIGFFSRLFKWLNFEVRDQDTGY